jgi:mannosyl-3-phosphoglycerate phosphatase
LKDKEIKTVIFTDLDGSLLNEKYDFQDVKPIIERLVASGVPIVFCSSKTRAEIEFYRKKMGINDPFISESGAAVFIPRGYFQFNYAYTRQADSYDVIELGAAYSIIRKKLVGVKIKSASKIIGFGDMTKEEIAKDSGLPLELAKLAKRREYDEPFRIVEGNEKEILNMISEEGLRYAQGGRYFHLTGNSDKGKAVAILKGLYSERLGKVKTLGIGDNLNDLSMLEVVDIPIFVRETNWKHARCAVWKEILNQVPASKSAKNRGV